MKFRETKFAWFLNILVNIVLFPFYVLIFGVIMYHRNMMTLWKDFPRKQKEDPSRIKPEEMEKIIENDFIYKTTKEGPDEDEI